MKIDGAEIKALKIKLSMEEKKRLLNKEIVRITVMEKEYRDLSGDSVINVWIGDIVVEALVVEENVNQISSSFVDVNIKYLRTVYNDTWYYLANLLGIILTVPALYLCFKFVAYVISENRFL